MGASDVRAALVFVLVLVLVLVLGALAPSAALAAEKPADTLVAARYQDEVLGDAEGALAGYRKVADAKGAEKKLVAEARYYLGKALYRLDKKDEATAEMQKLAGMKDLPKSAEAYRELAESVLKHFEAGKDPWPPPADPPNVAERALELEAAKQPVKKVFEMIVEAASGPKLLSAGYAAKPGELLSKKVDVASDGLPVLVTLDGILGPLKYVWKAVGRSSFAVGKDLELAERAEIAKRTAATVAEKRAVLGLSGKVTLAFNESPVASAIDFLAAAAEIDVKYGKGAEDSARLRKLVVNGRLLAVEEALDIVTLPFGFTWTLKDGAILV